MVFNFSDQGLIGWQMYGLFCSSRVRRLYILVHEMAHIIEGRHSKQFWRLVSRIIPDYHEHVLWLNKNGAELDL
jgi:hypothetical protein